MNLLKSIYNGPFKDLQPIPTCFPIIVTNEKTSMLSLIQTIHTILHVTSCGILPIIFIHMNRT